MRKLKGLDEPLRSLTGEVLVESDRLGPGTVENTVLRPDGDYDVQIRRPDGKSDVVQAAPVRVKSVIANALARAQSENPVRAMDIALTFHRGNSVIELDPADADMAKQAVLTDQALTNIAKAAALKVFEAVEAAETVEIAEA